MDSLRGKLLIAAPGLEDPNFRRAVVLVAEHTDEGAMGLVLNRPSGAVVGEAVPELDPLVSDDDEVFVGGPVQSESIVVLAEVEDPDAAALVILHDIGFMPADSDLEDFAAMARRARVFAGYAGWGPGQLEEELEREDWILEEAERDEVFTPDPDALWRDVLERKGGQYALVARMPEDPSLN
jgi:putative transcriptional regulator